MTSFTPQLDPRVRPQDDFFTHVNGQWLKENPIPKSETRWGTFNVLRENSWLAMKAIFEELQAGTFSAGSIEQQARDFYYTGMHFDELKDSHMQTLRDFLAEVDEMKSTHDISRMIGKLHSLDISGPWSCYVGSDHDDNTKHVLHFHQSGLTLPNRDYYLDTSDKMKKFRHAYEAHLQAVHALIPELATSAGELSDTLINFETAIATISRTPADLRDIENNYHKTPYKTVAATYKSIDWEAYARAFGWETGDHITIDQPEFMEYITTALTERPLNDWKIYLKWRFTSRVFPRICDEFAQLHFNFFGKVLGGSTEIMPLWKRVVLAAEPTLGEATGQLYSKKHFPESSKQQVLEIVEQVRKAYAERIEHLDWMSNKTKKYALKKLENVKVLIGYPDTWRDFTKLPVTKDSYVENVLAAQRFEVQYWFEKLRQPTSRDDWFMTPQTVNAYHDPTRLVICFPAAILQSPFFNPKASPEENLGGIGTVIGHELTHGFDDQGCQFDAIGNVKTWQTKEERDAFAQKAQLIVDHADSFEVLPGLNLRGKLVLGESIADLGGIEIALHALKNISPESDLSKFFITYAITECASVREEKLREYTLSDEHPHSEFRVNGILQHIDDFYKTFEVNETDKLYRAKEKRAKIW